MSNYSDSSFSKDSVNTSWYKIFQIIPIKSKILDIGCSSGNFGKELIERKDCIVDGIEVDLQDYLLAKKKLRKVAKINIETDEILDVDNDYDFIYFGDVIEHLINPVATLQKVKKLLNKNGKILFSIPNMANIAIRLELLRGDLEYTETGLLDKTHLHFYNYKEVLRVFSDAGFEIDYIDFVSSGFTSQYIENELEKSGLTGSKKFYEFCKTPEASAFQFIGTARSVNKNIKPRKLKKYGPINKLDEFYENIQKTNNEQIKLKNRRIEDLEKELNVIKKSKSYKLALKLSNTINKVKSPGK